LLSTLPVSVGGGGRWKDGEMREGGGEEVVTYIEFTQI
jgi:hypothetical protein